jgi:hypothetical protein
MHPKCVLRIDAIDLPIQTTVLYIFPYMARVALFSWG